MTGGTFPRHVCVVNDYQDQHYGESKIRICAIVPASRMKTWFIVWIMEKGKVVGVCPGQEALSINAAAIVAPVNVRAVKIARV